MPTGRKLVGYSTKDLSEQFLKGDIENTNLTAISHAVVKGVKIIALGEKQTADSTGRVHDPRVVVHMPQKDRKKTLVLKDLPADKEVEIIQIAFSSDPSKVKK